MTFPWSTPKMPREVVAVTERGVRLDDQLLPRPLVIPRPSPAAAPLEDNEVKAYATVADAIGFEPGALLHARLLALLRGLGIDTFHEQAVADYMTRRARRENADFRWWWRPLRPADVLTAWGWGQTGQDNFYHSSAWICRPYHRAVPLRVLSRVQQIETSFVGRVKFFVTDYGLIEERRFAGRPDPFIAAVALDMPMVIFDVWDEPDFGVR